MTTPAAQDSRPELQGTHPTLAPPYSSNQLAAHAMALGRAQGSAAAAASRGRPLRPRLDESARHIEQAYRFLASIARTDPQPVGSEDWLRDNYHVVQDQIREIRQDLPRKYYIELPKLADGPFDGYPRVYVLARELVSHTAGRLDLDTLVDFVSGYQAASTLSIGEIWAVPIMVRFALVEQLKRLADRIVSARISREHAARWVSMAADADPSKHIDSLLDEERKANRRLSPPFVVELLQWLRDQGAAAAPVWSALQRALEAQGDTADELVRAEHQREAADQVAIGNVITSMRLLSSIDWTVFFDRVSLVERTLLEDPAHAYAEMDFATKDRYRHSIEQLARGAGEPEIVVARRAVALARAAKRADPHNDRRHHVGYYLISRGRFALEQDLGCPPRALERLSRFIFKHPALGYLGTIAGTVAVVMASLLAHGARNGASAGDLWLIAAIVLIPASELGISLINVLLTSHIRPRPLPKLAMRGGIPAHDRTFVVVPAIIDTESRVLTLLQDLEVRFLANRDPHLHFALLTDFPDASDRAMPGDQPLIDAATRRVDELNRNHGPDRFFLFHRERRWNPQEQRWMGWERKRGKLSEFNRLLRGATDTSFVIRHGDLSVLNGVRYVITLDSDTQLPMDCARRLVGTLSHPLNRPRFDTRLQRVTEGYGVLQPRVGVSLESANRTPFARVFSGHVGIDPYTTAVSDVYQDLFHEGSFVGKGIYDVDAFLAALEDRVPENTLLSHDLFEGFYARTGLCTDIHLVDDYPTNYLSAAARQHRWVRGDWQIVRWLWRTVPDASGRAVRNTLPAIARWKIVDNLRRSLLPPALVALLVAGWTVLPGSSLVWMLLALLVLAFPAYAQVGRSLSSRARGVPLREHVLAERDTLVTSARQALLTTAFLLHNSGVMVDAIVRTIVRLLITRRHLLEWVTADRSSHLEAFAGAVTRHMWPVYVAVLLIAILVLWQAPGRFAGALPILVLWLMSPAFAYGTGLAARRTHQLDRDARLTFRRIARRTWRFFEDLVGPQDNWLVPDNLQENRREPIAHRTSPTNIGLQLLSVLAARHFGYVTIGQLLTRLERTLETLGRMDRYRGHFYNWYDTRTLAPLPPAYISTVDSGNLAGYLLTLRAGLANLPDKPIINSAFLAALRDAVDLCEEELTRAVSEGAAGALSRGIRREIAGLRERLDDEPHTLGDWRKCLEDVRSRLSALGVLLRDLDEPHLGSDASPGSLAEAAYWYASAVAAVRAQDDELRQLAGWLAAVPDGHPENAVPTLAQLRSAGEDLLNKERADSGSRPAAVRQAVALAYEYIERSRHLGAVADDLVDETEFDFLFRTDRQLFSIGFSVADGRLDTSHYDTLASEARLASFVAIALGRIPHEHWFRLGRSLTAAGGPRALLSWSASMFEYLMPLLVMRGYPNTLLDETYRAVVNRQIAYGASRGVPWGISESAYNVQDLDGNYQYRAFGVPGLGLKRGLADDLVVAPYATMLAALVSPADALANLDALRKHGLTGRYGYYEAIDYTPERAPKSRKGGVVLPTYMAHHQGMGLLALDNVLNSASMQALFHADARVQAAELLLQERIPHLVPLKNPPIEQAEHIPATRRQAPPAARRYLTPHTLSPRVLLLSNGHYSVMVTNAGGGYSRHRGLVISRWREDLTRDDWGTFCYVRDLDTGEVWSTSYQPTRREPETYEVTFAPDRAVFRRIDSDIEVRTEIMVSPEDPVEIRRVSVTNHSSRVRHIDLTSYAEVVLAPEGADLAHPAFSNLFVETSVVPERDAVMCVRRPREGHERLYLVHVLSGRIGTEASMECETDRARFVGRGRTLERPLAMSPESRLTGTTGAVLDPIVSLRQPLRIPPGGTARLSFATGFADNEASARMLIEKYHDRRAVARTLALAISHAQIELRHLGLTAEDTMRFQRLAGRLVYGDPRLRPAAEVAKNTRRQSDLWRYGISGDLPILLLRIASDADIALVRELLKAQEYLRHKGLTFDLVVLNDHGASYLQELQLALTQIVESSPLKEWIDRPGGIFLRRVDLIPPEDLTLIRAAARVEMIASDGPLRDQLKLTQIPAEPEPAHLAAGPGAPFTRRVAREERTSEPPSAGLEFFNGNGGFASGGREYVIHADHLPPVPWINVVANPVFGFAASEGGTGFTWSENSHDNRLTPWSNDPIRDPPGETILIRDEESGTFWSATPLPAGDGAPYTTRHRPGETAYEHRRLGLASTLVVFVPLNERLKVFDLHLKNESGTSKRYSVTLYVDWVLGEHRSGSRLHVVTTHDSATGAVFARNRFRIDFSHRTAFVDLYPGQGRTVTGDRTEFIGRNGTLARPAALSRAALSDRTGSALDPCGAVQVVLTLEPGSQRRIVGLLGDADDDQQARTIITKHRDPNVIDSVLAESRQYWSNLLGAIQVRTPDRPLDIMLNTWLPYQTLACRIQGRSAFYQSSGAFGFRDQLQDVLALLFAAPALAREHLLRAAARQFVEGDVQHWWHEPSGRGVRTRFADDRLWLPYAALHYVHATGDQTVLDERVPYLTGRVLEPHEHEAYEQPEVSGVVGSLYEHCTRAIALNLTIGTHGLPLMGGGDWNDGMNLVGIAGKGESVWLGWFLTSILNPFADLAESRGDRDLAASYRRHSRRVTEAIEDAWDGAWYRRAYFDDGTPMGSSANSECQIDAIAQSWAVIAGTGDAARARRAMESVAEHLVRRDDRLVLLLTPPFDRSQPSPGYIQGYLPGVRENGGQYTHAALWTVLAAAMLGDGDRAAELFALLNPINHTRTPEALQVYRVEPYVVAADVYSRPPHTGRGGWTWYTGSAGWMYRVAIEAILGLRLRNGGLELNPCVPRAWDRYEIEFTAPRAVYRIIVENPRHVGRGVSLIEVDGTAISGVIPVLQDGRTHDVRVVLG